MEDDIRRCNECNSLQTYVTRVSQERVCRSCGHVEDLKGGQNE